MEKDKSILLWVLIGVIILLFVFGGFGIGSYGMMGMGYGWLFMILFWVLIIWLIVTLINSQKSSENNGSEPLKILRNRYAKGEISKKEYERMRRVLE